MNTSEIADLINKDLPYDPVAVCIDGSAFDSTQFPQLQASVDGKFWLAMYSYLKRVFEHPDNSCDIPRPAYRLLTEINNLEKHLFVQAPGAQGV